MAAFLRRALRATASLVFLPIAAQAESTGAGPAAFASVPVTVSRTPFDAEWRRVSMSPSPANSIAQEARKLQGLDRLRFVSSAVNRGIAYREDADNWGADDYWASAAQTLSRGSGDCEDLAILKMQLLRAAGVPLSRMYLVLGQDLTARRAHALLLVREGGEMWVLDDSAAAIHTSDEHADFRPMMSFGAGGEWVHGYDVRTLPAFELADAGTRPHSFLPASGSLAATIAAQQGE